ncbi:VirK family protein [Rhizobium rhizogenes]|uniref:VirK family protein n=1 Tax=Rhizobium rhizogenes TaxID=359 RepID=UPI0022B5F0C9|nr:VirK family protein [Rhizobium rhizogenes]MCZ7448340.1 VirK family protein [Rhizobium rhizogenes]MCZ7465759.1 VirK family protein [Rhizobium rhizogenes]
MKYIVPTLFAVLLATGVNAANDTHVLATFPEIELALTAGKPVSVAVDLSLCAPANGDTPPTKTRGGIRIEGYRITADGNLAFADQHFTIDRDGEPILQFLRYQIRLDGDGELTMVVFKMPSYERKGASLAYKCAISHGLSFFTPQ